MTGDILVIEDEPTLRLLLEDYFETEGYAVLTAPDGAAALDIATRERFGLAFVDINLPDIQGDEVMRRMRGLGVDAELVVVSGNLRESYEDRIAGLRVRAVLEKPVDLLVLGKIAASVFQAA
jgi:DNA-binding response OmpR family regulator